MWINYATDILGKISGILTKVGTVVCNYIAFLGGQIEENIRVCVTTIS